MILQFFCFLLTSKGLLCQFFLFLVYEIFTCGLIILQVYLLNMWLKGHYITYWWDLVLTNKWHLLYNEAIHPINVSQSLYMIVFVLCLRRSLKRCNKSKSSAIAF